ncbi:MAG TPA: anti-sigma factor antagonist [Ilumatobacteraceae bacterium]|jgi:anti-sigma B factor antagonist
MDLSTTAEVIGDAVVVALRGEVDLSTVPVLQDALTRAIARQPQRPVVVDLDGVTALDDVGLGVLLGAAGAARRVGSDLTVVSTNTRLRERLDRTGFSRAIDVLATVRGEASGIDLG